MRALGTDAWGTKARAGAASTERIRAPFMVGCLWCGSVWGVWGGRSQSVCRGWLESTEGCSLPRLFSPPLIDKAGAKAS